MSVASTNKDIIQIKQQLKQLAVAAVEGHTHNITSVVNLQSALDAKQNTLTAGNNISLVGNSISAITTWENITGKPSTFEPATHTHIIDDVSGLGTALAGKSATGHTHTEFADLSQQLTGKQKTLTAGSGISLTDNGATVSVASTGSTQWTSGSGLIHYTGKVGVKNTSPTYDLDVGGSGDINCTGGYYINGVTQKRIYKWTYTLANDGFTYISGTQLSIIAHGGLCVFSATSFPNNYRCAGVIWVSTNSSILNKNEWFSDGIWVEHTGITLKLSNKSGSSSPIPITFTIQSFQDTWD